MENIPARKLSVICIFECENSYYTRPALPVSFILFYVINIKKDLSGLIFLSKQGMGVGWGGGYGNL